MDVFARGAVVTYAGTGRTPFGSQVSVTGKDRVVTSVAELSLSRPENVIPPR